MADDEMTPPRSPAQAVEPGALDLILQAIIPPDDAPAEIRASVADALAQREPPVGPAAGWDDISFAASVIALLPGTNQRAQPDVQWVFALTADAPRLGEQLQHTGSWASTLVRHPHGSGAGRLPWRIRVLDRVTTAPRTQNGSRTPCGPRPKVEPRGS